MSGISSKAFWQPRFVGYSVYLRDFEDSVSFSVANGSQTLGTNLNRATTISGVNRTYDILGNTLTKGSTTTYTWDFLNRMLSHTARSVTTNYAYRADGLRVTKDNGTTLSKFYYDGQMPIETTETTSSATVVTRNGLGARGIDRIERVGTSTTVGYPIYDGHGNMVATLAKSGSSYSLGDQRSYDAWGVIRSGNTTGDPKGRYCANLGHTVDDESGLTYMRARYYEAEIGRFLLSDPKRVGANWSAYCANNPTNKLDATGEWDYEDTYRALCALIALFQSWDDPGGPDGLPPSPTEIVRQWRKSAEDDEDKSVDEMIVYCALFAATLVCLLKHLGASAAKTVILESELNYDSGILSGVLLGA